MPEAIATTERRVAEQSGGKGEQASKGMLFIYSATIFLSAFLLFQIQLIIAKYILPLFGGAPAVWNTCMFCFQVLLLLGYGYAHRLSRLKSVHMQGRVHALLLALSALVIIVLWIKWGSPLTPGREWRPGADENPVLKILELLGATVALPFFVLSTTGPLLQKWFSRSQASAYRLYALSNAGSLFGLLSYPFFVEWAFNVKHQAWMWSGSYILLVVLCSIIALHWVIRNYERLESQTEERIEEATTRPRVAQYALWMGLSACSTTVLLATTNLLCQDLAVIPLLWVLPLSVYLVSFIMTFEHNRWYRRELFWPLYFVALGIGTRPEFLGYQRLPLVYAVTACGVSLFAVCMVCHGELARSKPGPRHLTSFYLALASGGALGGAFVVLVAPYIFSGFFEYQAGIVGCGLLLFVAFLLDRRSGKAELQLWNIGLGVSAGFLAPYVTRLLTGHEVDTFLAKAYFTVPFCAATVLIVQFLRPKEQTADENEAAGFPWQPVAGLLAIGVFGILVYGSVQMQAAHLTLEERNFFGVKCLAKTALNAHGENAPADEMIVLINGSTIHGAEFTAKAQRDIPTMYYGTGSGVGLLLSNHPRGGQGQALRIGVVGMGAGTLATYGRAGDVFRFYEIDPVVLAMSVGDRPYFHFVEDSKAQVEIVPGDARLSLEKEAREGRRQKFDVMVMDAFTSDSVPVHLLTEQAMTLYQEHLRNADSVFAFNVSNWYLDLRPVIAGLARQNGFSGVRVRSQASEWILLSANPAMLRLPNLSDRAVPLSSNERALFWTDSYSNLFQILRVPGK